MDIKKILFITFALAFSILSMYLKTKKQKSSLPKKEESNNDYDSISDLVFDSEIEVNYGNKDVSKMFQNTKNFSKKNKNKQKSQNFKVSEFQSKSSDSVLQNTDIETENVLLGDFEGTEIQKAFLYSEIFKTTNY
ncbi:MAG: hypothetical protein LBU83_13125 [Bacteroidales bacterium]|jgi:hypothetical protein|nr:hypothetical protein [Bacteroidales bacterium]